MPFQKVEFEFPEDEDNNKNDIEIESSEAIEIDLSGKPPKEEKTNTFSTTRTAQGKSK